ncbi:helix-turn-helix transcriptional regulator [Nonomuraea sp. NPDC046802]|uniref:ArsR/SmtB family transcription factor n=1 Tax=Nonomuraea sp. NPDC046802 TaxID=3154919 RepID=UPI0033FDD641
MGRTPPHPQVSQFDLQQVLEALVDPVRRSIVTRLVTSGEDLKCGAFDMPVSKSTATHHFKVLREAGLIRQYYVGTSRMNSLRRTEMDEAFPGLLDALTRAVSAPS